MRARVFVTLKPSVFDPQGRTIAEALHSLGYAGVEHTLVHNTVDNPIFPTNGKRLTASLSTTLPRAEVSSWTIRVFENTCVFSARVANSR